MKKVNVENNALESKLKAKDSTMKALRSALAREKQKSSRLMRIIEVLTSSKYLTPNDAAHLHVNIFAIITLMRLKYFSCNDFT